MKNIDRVGRVVEYIEENLNRLVSLEEISKNSGMSEFYLIRAFGGILGEPIMEYVRKRRLTEASRELINSDKPIIDISLDWGYDSQEAFTRAFKKVFKTTPAKYRKNGHVLGPFERHKLNFTTIITNRRILMKEPKLVEKKGFTVVGLLYHGKNENQEISTMWGEYNKRFDEIPNKVGDPCYGVCFAPLQDKEDKDYGAFDYIASHEVSKVENLPEGMTSKEVPAGKWLVFEHKGKLDTLENTYKYIYSQYFPNSEYEAAEMDMELYDDRFIMDSDESVFEIWVMVK